MRDTEHLTETETRANYLLWGMTDGEMREMAKVGLLLHLVYDESMSRSARSDLDRTISAIAPDFLLTFRALREQARHIARVSKTWEENR